MEDTIEVIPTTTDAPQKELTRILRRFKKLMPQADEIAMNDILDISLDDILTYMNRFKVAQYNSKSTNLIHISYLSKHIAATIPTPSVDFVGTPSYYYFRICDIYNYNNADIKRLIITYIAFIHYFIFMRNNKDVLGVTSNDIYNMNVGDLTYDFIDHLVGLAMNFYNRINKLKRGIFSYNLTHYFKQYYFEITDFVRLECCHENVAL